MYFYRSMFNFMPMPNAAFGSSFTIRQLALQFRHRAPRHFVLVSGKECRCRAPVVVFPVEVGRGFWLGLVRIWFALLACFAALFACLVCCFVLAFGCLCPCWASLPCYNWLPVWFVFVPAGGNRFALGTGGIRWSLLVGGLGPVLSIPKLCFKPFRAME